MANLLTDKAFRVRRRDGSLEYAGIREILTSDEYVAVEQHLSDASFYAVVFLIMVLQTRLAPENNDVLRERFQKPMTGDEVDVFLADNADLFEIFGDHPVFQDRRDIDENKVEVQDLFMRYPSGTQYTQFGSKDMVRQVCPYCAALALYMRLHGSFSGRGYLGGYYDEAMMVMLHDENLRRKLWLNVVPMEKWMSVTPTSGNNNEPHWFDPIDIFKEEDPSLLRATFLLPSQILLDPVDEQGQCDCCGRESDVLVKEFYKRPIVHDKRGKALSKEQAEKAGVRLKIERQGKYVHPLAVRKKKDGVLSYVKANRGWTWGTVANVLSYKGYSICKPLPIENGNHKLIGRGSEVRHLVLGGYIIEKNAYKFCRFDSVSLHHSFIDGEMGDRFYDLMEVMKKTLASFKGAVYNRDPQKVSFDSTAGLRSRLEPLVSSVILMDAEVWEEKGADMRREFTANVADAVGDFLASSRTNDPGRRMKAIRRVTGTLNREWKSIFGE